MLILELKKYKYIINFQKYEIEIETGRHSPVVFHLPWEIAAPREGSCGTFFEHSCRSMEASHISSRAARYLCNQSFNNVKNKIK